VTRAGQQDRDQERLRRRVAAVAEEIAVRFAPATVLGAGRQGSVLVDELRQRGIDATALDGASMTDPVKGEFDLVVCLDGLGDVDPEDAHRAVENLAAVSDRVLLSTPSDDLETPSTANVRPPEHWAELFASRGLYRDLDFDASFVSPWAGLFVRRTAPSPGEVVRDYERELARLRRESDQLRALLRTRTADTGELDQLRATVQSLRDDLRLAIDTAHAAEAAKGAEAGQRIKLENQVAAAEERLREMVDIVAHLDQRTADAVREHQAFHESRSYRLLNAVLAPYRRVRSR
jgi:hypothetical protein